VSAKVGRGKNVSITEETEYPFKGFVKMKITTAEPVRFPIYLRVPGWADEITFNFKGKTLTGAAGETVKLLEKWEDGDLITFRIPLDIRVERRFNNSVSILRGPLYYSLRIDKEYKSVKLNYDNFGYKGSVDWEIRPISDWNFGLLIDPVRKERGIDVTENTVAEYPFADKGDMIWSEENGAYLPWQKDAPVVITARAMKIPGWTLKDNSADLPPRSPVKPGSSTETVQLVPYGCTRLRITEFPVIDVTLIQDVVR
jgi:hypothetical protein